MHYSLAPALSPQSLLSKVHSKDGKDGKDGKDDHCLWPLFPLQDPLYL